MKDQLLHIVAKSKADPSKHPSLWYKTKQEAAKANPNLYDFRVIGYAKKRNI